MGEYEFEELGIALIGDRGEVIGFGGLFNGIATYDIDDDGCIEITDITIDTYRYEKSSWVQDRVMLSRNNDGLFELIADTLEKHHADEIHDDWYGSNPTYRPEPENAEHRLSQAQMGL